MSHRNTLAVTSNSAPFVNCSSTQQCGNSQWHLINIPVNSSRPDARCSSLTCFERARAVAIVTQPGRWLFFFFCTSRVPDWKEEISNLSTQTSIATAAAAVRFGCWAAEIGKHWLCWACECNYRTRDVTDFRRRGPLLAGEGSGNFSILIMSH